MALVDEVGQERSSDSSKATSDRVTDERAQHASLDPFGQHVQISSSRPTGSSMSGVDAVDPRGAIDALALFADVLNDSRQLEADIRRQIGHDEAA